MTDEQRHIDYEQSKTIHPPGFSVGDEVTVQQIRVGVARIKQYTDADVLEVIPFTPYYAYIVTGYDVMIFEDDLKERSET